MNIFEISESMIEIYQKNFSTFRKVCNLTCQEVGDMIGVTKQTISNIERRKTKLTKSQCILLRLFVIEMCKDNVKISEIANVLNLI